MSDELIELPEGWKWVKLEDIASHISGIAFKSTDFTTEGIQVIRLGNVYKGELNLNRDPVFLPKEVADKNFVLKPGNIIVSQTGTRFKRDYGYFVAIPQNAPKLLLNQRLLAVSCHFLIDSQYVVLASKLKSYQDNFFTNETGGVNQGNVGVAGIMKGEIPLPPLNEQKRIVAEIEALRERSQKARSALLAIPELCDKFRQSVLAAAFRGDLTADWREQNPNVEPASVLLERIKLERRKRWEATDLERMKTRGKAPQNDRWKEKYLELEDPKVSIPKDSPQGWAWTTIGHVAECLDSKRVPINKEEREKRQGDIPYYGANGQVGWIDEFIFDEPLVILVEDETFLGRTKPFCYKITGKSWVNNHAHVLRSTEVLDLDYLNYSLMFYPFIPLTSGTTGRRKLTQSALMTAPYALPPLKEQHQIVAIIEQYFETVERIQAVLKSDFDLIAQIDRSILAKAFRGELVEQDPNDEPASVLLDLIRVEREQQTQGKAKKLGKKADSSTHKRDVL